MKKIFFILLILILAGILPALPSSCPEILNSWGYGPAEAISLYENYLYFSSGRVFEIYDISIPNSPKYLSEIMVANTIQIIEVKKIESKIFAFLGVYRFGITIIDVTDPENPFICSSYNLNSDLWVCDLDLDGNYLYLSTANLPSGLFIFDLSDICNPKMVSFIRSGSAGCAILGSYAFISGWPDIETYDISDPKNPVLIGSKEVDRIGKLRIIGNFMYLCSNDGFMIIDISNPLDIKIVGSYEGFDAEDFDISQGYAYIASYFGGVVVLDIKDPYNPEFVKLLYTDNRNYRKRAYDIVIYNDEYAYVANYGCIWVINLKDTEDYFFIPIASGFYHLAVKDNYLFAPNFGNGIWVIDFSDLNNLKRVSLFLKEEYKDRDNYVSAYIDGDILYYGSWLEFGILDISNPKEPKEISSYYTGYCGIYDMKIKDGFAYTPCISKGLDIFDVSDIKNPILVSELKIPTKKFFVEIELYKNYVYLLEVGSAIYIIDVSNPKEPKVVKKFDYYHIFTFAIKDNYLFFADINCYLYVYDLEDPISPKFISKVKVPHFSFPEDILIDGNILYLSIFYSYFYLIDISNLKSPKILKEIKNPGNGSDFLIKDNLLFHAVSDSGIDIYDISRCILHQRPF
jgi:hypothetical protein